MEYLRSSGLLLAIVGLIIYGALWFRRPAQRHFLIAPLSWLLFTALFLLAALGNQEGWWYLDANTLNIWSSLVRLYSLILVIGIGAVWLVQPQGAFPHDLE